MHGLCLRIHGCASKNPPTSPAPTPTRSTPTACTTAARGPRGAGLGGAVGFRCCVGAGGRWAHREATVPSAGRVEAVPWHGWACQHWEEPARLQKVTKDVSKPHGSEQVGACACTLFSCVLLASRCVVWHSTGQAGATEMANAAAQATSGWKGSTRTRQLWPTLRQPSIAGPCSIASHLSLCSASSDLGPYGLLP